MKLLQACALLLLVNICYAQNNQLGTWVMVTSKYSVNSKWNMFIESQIRSQLFFNHFFYYEVKGGIGYAFNKNSSVLIGAGRYATYSNNDNFKKPFSNEEVRIWEQLTMNQRLEKINFEHRYRIEQRWLSNGGYRNRFRYRLNAIIPLNNKLLDPKTFYLSVFDEIFLTNTAPYFERNRFLSGLGYKFNKQVALQPGYLYQFDYRADNSKAGKAFFQLSLFIELERTKSTREKLPTVID